MLIIWYITLKGILNTEIDLCQKIITQEFGMKLKTRTLKKAKIIKKHCRRKMFKKKNNDNIYDVIDL